MRYYSLHIKKFFYSQYFYGGLRIAVGVSLPAVLMLMIFHDLETGFTISTGALSACMLDRPGPLKYKHNEMLACTLIGFLCAFVTGTATANALALWLTVIPVTFALSMLVVYGFQWPQISFATLFIMAVTLEKHFTPTEALIHALWTLTGGLWYTYWSTSVSHWQSRRASLQAIAESVFASADYLRARASFYEINNDLDECYRQLVAKQVAAIDYQDAARDIVLRNLPHTSPRIFNLFINIVDLHEMVVAAHTDYALMRSTFAASDVMIFFRDLILKIAHDLEDIGLAALQNRPAPRSTKVKAELRALEYEIDTMRKKRLPEQQPEAYASLGAAFRRVWSVSRLIDRMRLHTQTNHSIRQTEINIDQKLQSFLKHRRVTPSQIFSNLKIGSPAIRHAARVTAAVAMGLWLGKLLPLTHSYWICLTSLIILKPGFSLTRQRNGQRLIGTGIGCIASIGLVTLVPSRPILLLVMFASMVMSHSLLLFNYTASTVFTSAYVLILYHLLVPTNLQLIGERALDTAIGGAIAVCVSYLFPYWEYRVMRPLVKKVISSMRHYLEALSAVGKKQHEQAHSPASLDTPPPPQSALERPGQTQAAPSSPPNPSQDVQRRDKVTSEALRALANQDFGYRLARKNMQIAFSNLGNAFSRMMLEPKSKQRFVAELNDLLIQSHVLAAQITAAAPLIASATLEPSPLMQVLNLIRNHLAQAEVNVSPRTCPVALSRAECLQEMKALTRELDAMVSGAQHSGSSPEHVQELRLFAHQAKQMLATVHRIRKDTAAIQLPPSS